MTDPTSQFVSIHTLANRFEGDLLMDALEKESIPAILRTFEETPYDGLFITQRGWGRIMVPEDMAERGKQIIKLLLENIRSRGIFTDPSEIDPLLWETLRQRDPQDVCMRALVDYDPKRSAYRFPFLGCRYFCSPGREIIEPEESLSPPADSFNFYLAILHYLLEARSLPLKGNWIGEKEIPGGELFFRGHHRLPLDPLKDLFGTRPELFEEVSRRTGAVFMNMGDLAYRFQVLPRIPMVFILWKGDEEFGAELKVLFDETVSLHLHSLDTVWAFVGAVCSFLRRIGKGGSAADDTPAGK